MASANPANGGALSQSFAASERNGPFNHLSRDDAETFYKVQTSKDL